MKSLFLKAIEGPGAETEFRVESFPAKAGRKEGCDVFLNYESISGNGYIR